MHSKTYDLFYDSEHDQNFDGQMGNIFFHVEFFLKLTRDHDRVSMLSFMLLDCSSDL